VPLIPIIHCVVSNACRRVLVPIFSAVVVAISSPAHPADTNVAVAANFTEPAKEIALAFERKTGHRAILSFGATGQFYTQITEAAPFQVFLSADQSTPKKLVDEGFAISNSVFTYAVGKIVLFSTNATLVSNEHTLRDAKFNKLAIADPTTAPYGAAAVEAMKALGVYVSLVNKIVQGSNIAQTFQFVETGNAELGFVALSQVVGIKGGSRWIVPANLYGAIRQDAVLLRNGADSVPAKAFLEFMKGPEAVTIIEKFGYGTN
jgi:molybdate transport system substrate-binding protein